MTNEEIGIFIRTVRESRKLTQKEVAEKLGFSSQTISLWEFGKACPKMETVFALCQVLNCSVFSFLNQEFVEGNESVGYDGKKTIENINKEIDNQNVKKKVLEYKLNVSRPTLNKILNEETPLNLYLFLKLVELLKKKPEDIIAYEHVIYKEPEIPKKRNTRKARSLTALTASVILLGISSAIVTAHFLKDYFSNNVKNTDFDAPSNSSVEPTISDEIKINYLEKTLEGFQIGKNYSIQNQIYHPSSESLSIPKNWFDKTITLRNITDQKPAQEIFIDSNLFENYFDTEKAGTTLYKKPQTSEILLSKVSNINKLTQNDSGISKDVQKNYYLTTEDAQILEESLSYPLTYLGNDSYDKYFENISGYSSLENLDYSIQKDGSQSYVSINGVINSQTEKLFIPKEIEGLEDIRIADYAFSVEKSPDLSCIVFEEKPHYIGDYVFKGLNLDILDFGIYENLDYQIDYHYLIKNSSDISGTVNYSNAFNGIKKIKILRLPKEYGKHIYFTNLFGKNNAQDQKEFEGIDSLFISNPLIKKDSFTVLDMANLVHLKLRSIYVPKRVRLDSKTTQKDLYLRLVNYEPGYNFYTSNTQANMLYGNDFSCCYALEYINGETRQEDEYYASNRFLFGAINFRGQIDYERICRIKKNAFAGASLPTKITLENVTNIEAHAFYRTYGLNTVIIKKSAAINKENPLTIGANVFKNSDQFAEEARIKKIIFEGFSDEELNLHSYYKDPDIEVQYL